MILRQCGGSFSGFRRARGETASGRGVRTMLRFIHDLADRVGAAPALRTAAKTAVDLEGGARRSIFHHEAHVVIAQHIAGADDH